MSVDVTLADASSSGRCLCGRGCVCGCGYVVAVEVAMAVNVDAVVGHGCGRSVFRAGSKI